MQNNDLYVELLWKWRTSDKTRKHEAILFDEQ